MYTLNLVRSVFFRVLRLAAHGVLLGAAAVSPGAFAEDPTEGREAYIRVGCWACHGYEGQGGIAGPRLAPDPLPFEAFAHVVRHAVAEMPEYSAHVLSEEELAQIYAYILSRPPSPDPQEIPAW